VSEKKEKVLLEYLLQNLEKIVIRRIDYDLNDKTTVKILFPETDVKVISNVLFHSYSNMIETKRIYFPTE